MMQWRYDGQPAGNGWTVAYNNAAFGTDYIHRMGAVKGAEPLLQQAQRDDLLPGRQRLAIAAACGQSRNVTEGYLPERAAPPP